MSNSATKIVWEFIPLPYYFIMVNQTGWMTVVVPADRPKVVRNSCVIERICSVFVSFHLWVVCRLGVFGIGQH